MNSRRKEETWSAKEHMGKDSRQRNERPKTNMGRTGVECSRQESGGI
jgi:hypothetical protein